MENSIKVDRWEDLALGEKNAKCTLMLNNAKKRKNLSLSLVLKLHPLEKYEREKHFGLTKISSALLTAQFKYNPA